MDHAHGHVRAVARTACIFAFPLVLHYADLHAQAIDRSSPNYTGFGTWRHAYRDEQPRHSGLGESVESVAWIDVRAEPWVLGNLRGEGGCESGTRIADLWGHVTHRSTSKDGSADASCVIGASPTWVGEIPGGVDHVVRGESSFLQVVVSTEVRSDEQRRFAKMRHEGCVLGALSEHSDRDAPESPQQIDWLPLTADAAVTNHFWSGANFAMSLVELQPEDEGILNRIAEIGVVPGEPWDPAWFSFGMLEAISAGIDDALADLLQASRGPLHLERLGRRRQDYDFDYFGRALSALIEPGSLTLVLPGGKALSPGETRRRQIL